MRTLAIAVFVLSVAFLHAGDDEKDKKIEKPNNKDVKVKVTFPKEATFSEPKAAGGQVGIILVKVEVMNTSDKDIPLSSANFNAKVKGLMGGIEKLIDAFQLEAGKTAKQERKIILHTVLPKDGDQLEVELYVYGHKKVGKVKAKVK